ncbi:MAG: glycogen synthase [Thermoplasmata archaeon]
MKVCILSLEYPPNVYGGVGHHVAAMASALSRHIDVEVRTLWVPGARGERGVRRYGKEFWGRGAGAGRGKLPAAVRSSGGGGGSARRRRSCPDGGRMVPRAVTYSASPPSHQPALDALRLDIELVSDPMDCDIVHSHTWYMNLAGALAKKLYGIPAVATVHSLEPLRPWKAEQLGRGYELSKWMEREGLLACDRVIAVSEGMKRDITRCYPIPPSKISVVHNGIDPRVFRPSQDMRVLKRCGVGRPYVLFVGRLTRQKGVQVLVEASRGFPPGTQTVLATGRPDEPGIVAELAGLLKGRRDVVWLNRALDRRELVALYSSASVSVTPSLYEPFGLVVLEAMACGSPVVASRVGGIPEIVEDGRSGFLVPPGDSRALAEAVSRLLGDEELRERFARRARERVERRFTWDIAARKTLDIYRRLCGRV